MTDALLMQWKVLGEKGEYIVSYGADGEWRCACPHNTFRKILCKHIFDVQEWRQSEGKANLPDVQGTGRTCVECGTVLRMGHWSCRVKRKGKTAFTCMDHAPDNLKAAAMTRALEF